VTAALVAAYLIGSVPFALILARRWGAADLRRVGSGNLGAANVMRASGFTAGVLVALLDMAKGAIGVVVAARFSDSAAAPATACGVFSMLTPIAIPPALAIFLLTVALTKYISLGSLLATLALPTLAYAMGSPAPAVAAAIGAAAIIVFRHRTNVTRLRTGTERRFGVRG
jgi:acyl phosphate:glycerol-3-phosphate acyltransferase